LPADDQRRSTASASASRYRPLHAARRGSDDRRGSPDNCDAVA
jgi:hypothetical protein